MTIYSCDDILGANDRNIMHRLATLQRGLDGPGQVSALKNYSQ